MYEAIVTELIDLKKETTARNARWGAQPIADVWVRVHSTVNEVRITDGENLWVYPTLSEAAYRIALYLRQGRHEN